MLRINARICELLAAIALPTAMFSGVTLSMVSCSAHQPTAPAVLSLDHGTYGKTFDAAVALIADEGMPAVLRDRDGGVIESRPNIAGSLLEPWDWPRGDVGAAAESTIGYERRRVRFEFVPSGFRPRNVQADASDSVVLEGQRTPGSADPSATGTVNLGGYEGPLELRVWVYVERAFTPNVQRSTWTFRDRSVARDPLRQTTTNDGTTRDRSIWTPVSRDPAMEADILAKLKNRLG